MGHYTIVKNTITQEWEEGFFFSVVVFYSRAYHNKWKLMLKHQQRNYFFYSFPRMSNFALLLLFIYLFYWALINQIIHLETGGGRVERAVKFDYSLCCCTVWKHSVAFSIIKKLPEGVLGGVTFILAGR